MQACTVWPGGARYVQVETSPQAWQYVKESPEGFRFGIYPAHGLTADRLQEVMAAHPGQRFRVEPPSRTSPSRAARIAWERLQTEPPARFGLSELRVTLARWKLRTCLLVSEGAEPVFFTASSWRRAVEVSPLVSPADDAQLSLF